MARDAKFDLAVKTLLKNEGGYRNRPSDPGGPTKYGISQRSYPKIDIKGLTPDAAVQIYWADWWEKYGYYQISNYALAMKLLDMSVVIGPGRAHKFLQQAANEIIQTGSLPAKYLLTVDGALGRLSYETINQLDPAILLLRFLARVHAHFRKCSVEQPDELDGWVARLWSCF